MLDGIQAKRLTGALVVVTFLVIALGGVVRIYDAGESCPDWPACFGGYHFDIPPEQQQAWWADHPGEEDQRWLDDPDFAYTTDEIFTEWAHRLLAGAVLGPLVLLNWLLVRRDEGLGSEVRLASSVAVVLIVWQGAVGWLTVRMDNELWLAASRDQGELPSWADFERVGEVWHRRLLWLSTGALFTLFSGAFVSTTGGANFGCGVNGLYDSWPLCHGELITSLQSQVIHRWLVVGVGVALLLASRVIWKEFGSDSVLCKWIWGSTALYLANIGIGASYILSWDLSDESFAEYLSLIHLLLASLSFIILTTTWMGATMALVAED